MRGWFISTLRGRFVVTPDSVATFDLHACTPSPISEQRPLICKNSRRGIAVRGQNMPLRIKTNPPAIGCKKRIVPILLHTFWIQFIGRPARAVNTNRALGVGCRLAHELIDVLPAVSDLNLLKSAAPCGSLPKQTSRDQ